MVGYKRGLQEKCERKMATLKEEQSYGLSCGRLSNGKNTTIFHVKLTDSALRAIENYQSSKGSAVQPSIQFTGSQGRITIPRNRAAAEEGRVSFTFYLSHVGRDGPQGSFDCIQQYTTCDGAVELDSLGVIQDKITVNATDDSYQKARQNMAQVEKETRGRGAIVIKQGGRYISKRVQIRKPGLPGVMTPTRRSHLSRQAAASPPVRPGTGRPKQVAAAAALAAAAASMPIRARLVHLLVLKPYRRAELVLRLERDGLAPADKDAIDNLLAQVANQNERNRSFSLKEEVLGEVKRSWPGYTVGDQQLLKRILLTKARKLGQSQNLLSSPATVELTSSPQREQANSSPSQRRPAPEYIDPVANKKPRISHLASRADNQVNGALAQERAASPAPMVAMASEPRLLPRLEITQPSEPLDVRPDSGANGRDCEGSNTSALSDRLGHISSVPTTTHQSLPVLSPSIQPAVADVSSAASSHKYKSRKKTKKHKDKDREGGRAKERSRGKGRDVDGTTPEDVNNGDSLSRVTDLNGMYEHQNLTTTASDPEEYLKTYTRIISQEQRQKYKSDFNVEYNEYRKLHAHIEAVTRHFTILHGQINDLQKDSDQYQTIRNQIFQEYRQIKKSNPNYSQDKSRCEYLHRKLAHIKKTIGEYDHKQL